MSALAIAAQTGGAAAAATLLHEMAHILAAILLRRFSSFDVWNWEVLYRVERPLTWKAYAIAGAPLGIGIVLLPVILVVGPTIPLLVGWGIFTFLGALTNDFEFRAVSPA